MTLRLVRGDQEGPHKSDGPRLEIVFRLDDATQMLLRQLLTSGLLSAMQPHPASADAVVAGVIRPSEPSNITRSIETWQADMERRGCRASSVKQFGRHARLLAEYMGWSSVEQITLAGAQEYLAAQRKAGWTGTTHDGAVSALKCYTRFLYNTKLIQDNTLQFLEASGEQGGQGARALTLTEARGIVAAAQERARRTRKDKGCTALFVAFLCHTGLRHEEASRCTWGCIDTDADPPVLVTDPAWAKNGRRDTVPLHPELVRLLERHRASVPDAKNRPIFPHAPNRHTWHIDREAAGVSREDSRGRSATFHSCRKYLATMLDRTGASPGTVARILRHAEGITQQRYIDADICAEVEAVKRLPELWPESGTKILDGTRARADSPSAETGSMPRQNLTTPSPSVARSTLAGSAPVRGTGRATDRDRVSERPALADRPCSCRAESVGIQHGNGQSRT